MSTEEAMMTPDGVEIAQEDYTTVPLLKLLADSQWKARKAGYERIKATLDDKPDADDALDACPELSEVMSSFPSMMKETLPAAFEPALDAVFSLLSVIPQGTTEVSDTVITAIVDRGLVGRPRAVQVSGQLLALLVELGNGVAVMEALMKGSGGKNPKLRVASVQTMVKVVNEFGLFPNIPLKPLIKGVCGMCNDTNSGVRREALALVKEVYRYLGDGIRGFLSDLRDVQQQELEKEFAAVDRTTVAATRFVRGAAPPKSAKGKSGDSEAPAAAAPAPAVDLRDLHDATPVISKLPKNFYSVVLDKTLKWQERNNMVQENLVPLIKAPCLVKEDYTELTKAMRDLMTDSQLPLQVVGIRCLGDICAGLGENFAPFVRFVLPQLMDKFKEKKAAHLDALNTTMNNLVDKVVGLCDIHDELEATALSKVPNQRTAVLSWAVSVVERNPSPKNLSRLSNASAMFTKLMNDEKAEVREQASILVQAVTKAGGGSLGDLAAKAESTAPKKKVEPLKTGALSARGGGAPSTNVSPIKDKKEPASARSIPSARSTPRVGSAKATPAGTPSAAAGGGGIAGEDSATLEHQYMSIEEVTATLGPVIGEEIFPKLASKDWQVRKDAVVELQTAISSLEAAQAATCSDAIVFLLRQTPSWKDTNAQVCMHMMGALTALCQKAGKLSPRAGYHSIAGPVTRFSDARSKTTIHELLLAIAECIGPKFVIRHVAHCAVQMLKNTKVSVEAVGFIEACMRAFGGIAVGNGKIIVEVCKACLDQTNPQLKAAATRVVLTAHSLGVTNIIEQLGDIKPQIKSSLEAEVAKNGNAEVAPTRAVREDAQEAGDAPGVVKGGRVDISSTINAALLKTMSSAGDWKDRMACVKKVEDAVVAAGRNIAPAGMTECLKALKLRLEEPNKNAVMDTIRTIGIVVEALGPNARVCGKVVLSPAINLLTDQKPATREHAAKVVEAMATVGGIEMLMPVLPKAMASDVVHARQAIVELTVKSLEANPVATPKVLAPIVPPLLRALMDKNQDTRAAAEQLLGHVANNVGFDHLSKCLTDLKPAEQQTIRGMLERYRDVTINAPQSARAPQPQVAQTAPAAMAAPADVAPQLTAATEVYVPPTTKVAAAAPIAPAAEPVQRTAMVPAAAVIPAATPESVVPPAAVAAPVQTRVPSSAVPPAAIPASSSVANFPGSAPTFRESIQLIKSGSLEHALHQCSDWCRLLEDSRLPTYLASPANDLYTLTSALLHRLRVVVDGPPVQATAFDKVIATIHLALSCKDIVCEMNATQLGDLIVNILDRLLDERMHDVVRYVRGLNTVMLALLENAHIAALVEALMHRLLTSTRTYLAQSTKANHKFMELTVKCFIKVSRRVPTAICDDDIVRILNSQHLFLEALPPSAFRDHDDLALRAVKTMLNEVVRVRGPGIRRLVEAHLDNSLVMNFVTMCISRLDGETTSNSIAESAQNNRAAAAAPPQRVQQQHADPVRMAPPLSNLAPNVSASTPPADNTSLNQHLTNVFLKIRRLNQTENGLVELFALMKAHPEVDITPYYCRCSEAFQTYIYRRIKKFIEEDVSKGELAPNAINIPAPGVVAPK
eukprot:PhM_4_TR3604/c0_g1_i1/m.630/K16803/CKAP5, XMAP215; cytoskeleton-associated protein 5